MFNLTKKVNNKKIVLGMSGGVDSSVCAYLLKKQGYHVIGLFMQNWDSYANGDFNGHVADDANQCNAQKDFDDAKQVADKLGIEIHRTEFIDKYWKQVFAYMLDEYNKGRTPNPDILCNKYIKFKEFIDYAKKEFDCDNIAMGHYANTKIIRGTKYLTRAVDDNKDQTYFLCWLNQEQLNKAIFPLGKIKKNKVRQIAKAQGLDNWAKKDSTGICFIGERKFKDFLNNYIKKVPGDIVDIVTNKVMGTHDGVMFYTYGQNRQLNLGGNTTKYFVCGKNVKNNILFIVDQEHKAKYLSSTKCVLEQFNWINSAPKKDIKVKIRFRHRQKLIPGFAKIIDDKVQLKYKKTLSVTPGQFAVLYNSKICLGGGIVEEITSN